MSVKVIVLLTMLC